MGLDLEAAPEGGVLHDAVGGAGLFAPGGRGLAEEIERLRAMPREGDIAIGGATLAVEAAGLGLIDEYRARVYPVLVGRGIPYFPRSERRVDLELVETRTFSSRVVDVRCRVAREPTRPSTDMAVTDRAAVHVVDHHAGQPPRFVRQF